MSLKNAATIKKMTEMVEAPPKVVAVVVGVALRWVAEGVVSLWVVAVGVAAVVIKSSMWRLLRR